MPCEKFKPALIEAAATGADLPPAVRAHADACPSCAAELTQQRSLVAAIDAHLHHQMNAPVSAAVLQRFEAHLAQEPHPKRTPRVAQIFASAFATLAVAALVLLFLSHWRIETLEQNAKPNVAAVHNSGAGEMQVHIGPSLQTTTSPSIHSPTRKGARTVLVSTPSPKHPEPEVLVPPDDRIALEHFMADSSGRGVLAAVLGRRVPQQEIGIAPLDVPDIQTASLKVPSIQDSDAVSNR